MSKVHLRRRDTDKQANVEKKESGVHEDFSRLLRAVVGLEEEPQNLADHRCAGAMPDLAFSG